MDEGFEIGNFEANFDGRGYVGQIIYLEKSAFIWISNADAHATLGNLTVAISTKYEKMPLASNLLSNGFGDESSCGLGIRLAKRFGIQVFVSFNAEGDEAIHCIERKICEILSAKYANATKLA
jgi:hypothetical protein